MVNWSGLGTLVAIVISLASLGVAWRALRQGTRLRAQPKLVHNWSDVSAPNNGIFFRTLTLSNHGDAAARDIRIEVEYVDLSDSHTWWQRENEIEPGANCSVIVPIVDAVSQSLTGYGDVVLDRKGAPETYAFVTPTVTVRWRQAPYDRDCSERIRAPKTPDLLNPAAQ